LQLHGRADATVARRLGSYLATIHRETAYNSALKAQFGDTEVFVQLRVDPFYRRIADVSGAAAPHIERLIAEMFSLPVCLVLADFSPKNVLIAGEQIVLVDFETGHYGDPAFDLGFFLSHLLLKTVYHAGQFVEFSSLTMEFWAAYLPELTGLKMKTEFAPAELARRTARHLAACMWSRIDGTSRVDYLGDAQQAVVREFCQTLFLDPPVEWRDLLSRLRTLLEARPLVAPVAVNPV
jgi:aminoglycoside phosphotransferase (APT) family kinase protein